MRKIRVGVVGVGHLGQHHARIYSQIPDVQLVGVADIDRVRAAEVAARYNTKEYLDYGELLNQVEAVSIVVPTILHYQITKDFLENDVNVLLEKPMTRTLKEAEELLEIAKGRGLILQVGHIERFNTGVKELENIVKDPRFIECHRLGPFGSRGTDVGVVLDLMIHDIDIIMSLVKSPVNSIDAVGIPVLTANEDIANARIQFANGCVADITASRIAPEKVRKIRIFQEDCQISLDYLSRDMVIYRRTLGKGRNGSLEPKIIMGRRSLTKEEPLKLEIEDFIDCIKRGKQPLVSGEEGKEALEIALRVLVAINSRKSEKRGKDVRP